MFNNWLMIPENLMVNLSGVRVSASTLQIWGNLNFFFCFLVFVCVCMENSGLSTNGYLGKRQMMTEICIYVNLFQMSICYIWMAKRNWELQLESMLLITSLQQGHYFRLSEWIPYNNMKSLKKEEKIRGRWTMEQVRVMWCGKNKLLLAFRTPEREYKQKNLMAY